MKATAAVLLFAAVVTAGKATEPRRQGSETLAASLKNAAGEDARLSVNEIESVLGQPDRIEPSPTWRSSELRIYLLSDSRRLEVTRSGDSIYLAVIIGKNGNTLIQK